MAHRQFALSDVQAAELRQAYRTTKDGAARTRYQAVRLYGAGYSVPHIQEITGCSRTSLLDWCRRYCTSGLAGLIDGRVGGNRAKLTRAQRQTIGTKLHQYTPRQLFGGDTATRDGQFWTIADLKRAVQHWVGVTWTSNSSYLTLLTDCGFSYQRTQKVFTSRNEAQVVAFEEQLEKN
jgi:transposase